MATTANSTTINDSDDILASLTASFNRNHIGQEGVDLDLLQAQLKEALAHATSVGRPSHVQPPNTPTQSILPQNFPHIDNTGTNARSKHHRGHRHSCSKTAPFSMLPAESEDLIMIEEEEEQEVEDLLAHQNFSSAIPIQQSTYSNPFNQHHLSHTTLSPTSSFAVTDPFYAMSVQSHQPRQFMGPQTAFFSHQQN